MSDDAHKPRTEADPSQTGRLDTDRLGASPGTAAATRLGGAEAFGSVQPKQVEAIRQALEESPDAGLATLASDRPSIAEAIGGIVGLLAWISFFAAGTLVSTERWRGQLMGSSAAIAPASTLHNLEQGASGFVAWVLCIVCYTVTNLFFLSCLSAFLGCMASRWPAVLVTSREEKTDISKSAEITHTEQTKLSPHVNELWKSPGRRVYPSALLRGFFLYTVLIAGLLVISTESSIIQTTPAQYVRLAGFVSALAFIIGYDPDMIQKFIMRAKNASLPSSNN